MLCVWQKKADDARRRAGPVRRREGPASTSATATASARWAGPAMPAAAGRPGRWPSSPTPSSGSSSRSRASGIPVIFHEECLHGHAAPEGTSFPQPIGLGATFDPELVERLYAMTAAEARARGTHQALTPVVDVAREPRWGRVEETFGEDPYLVARLGVAAVRGFQGDATLRRQDARHRHAEALRRARPARVGHQLRAGQRVDARAPRGVPLDLQGGHPGGRRPQRDGVLQRDRRRPVARQPLARSKTCCARSGASGLRRLRLLRDPRAARDGDERDRPPRGPRRQGTPQRWRSAPASTSSCPTPTAIRISSSSCARASIPESLIDERVRPMLRAKFQLGLFDDPYVDPAEAERIVREPAHRDLALEAARRRSRCSRTTAPSLPLDPRRHPAHRRHRPERRPRDARRLQRRAAARRPRCSQGIRDRVPAGVEVALPRRLQDHRSAAPGSRTR